MNKIIVVGGGCFWCTEAVFRMLKGVISVVPGYAGGPSRTSRSDNGGPSTGSGTKKPTYEEVCSGTTGHAEVIKIEYEPNKISFRDLLTVFFATHDPTTPNRQGGDVGTQYRSIILYSDQAQKEEAEKFIEELNEGSSSTPPATGQASSGTSHKDFSQIVTEVKPLDKFFEAENYHKDYYAKNRENPYCQVVINPKLEKVQEKFAKLLK